MNISHRSLSEMDERMPVDKDNKVIFDAQFKLHYKGYEPTKAKLICVHFYSRHFKF